MSGVWLRISVMAWRSSCRSAMNMRGISGKWNAMWHSSPSPKYGADVGRPLVRFGQQHAVLVGGVELAAHPLQHRVRLGQVLVVGAFAHAQVRHRVEPQRVDAEIEPELHHVDHRVDDRRVVVIEVGLVREEAVPVVLAGDRVVGPVRLLGVGEDDPRLGELLVGVAPDVELALGRSRRRVPRALEPRMLIRGVVDDQLDQHLDVRARARRATNALKSSSVP